MNGFDMPWAGRYPDGGPLPDPCGGRLRGKLVGKMAPQAPALNREGLRKLTEDAWFSSHRIRAELGFEPGYNLEDEIPVMVEEYLEATRSATKH